jgi:hypothetical protein
MDVELEDEEGANNNTSTVLPLHNRQHSGHEREEEAAAATPDERAAFLVHGPDDSDDEQGIAMSEARLANRTRSRWLECLFDPFISFYGPSLSDSSGLYHVVLLISTVTLLAFAIEAASAIWKVERSLSELFGIY